MNNKTETRKLFCLFSVLCLLFLFGCSKEPAPFVFIASPKSQRINNLYDSSSNKKSRLVFWNTSTMSKPTEFLKPCFFETLSIGDNKYLKFDLGQLGDIPLIGYFDQDSTIDYGVYRSNQGTSEWLIKNGQDNSGVSINFGEPGDLPVPNDYDGDGKFDIVIYRPQDSSFRGILSGSGIHVLEKVGINGDVPVPKDYDGDGICDFATYSPRNGAWTIRDSMTGNLSVERLGGVHFLPIPADYDGDGKADLCVWNFIDNTIKATLTTLRRPLPSDIVKTIQKDLTGKGKDFFPVSCDYDGDGSSELAFWSKSLKTLLSFDIRQPLRKRVYKLNNITNSEPVINFLLTRLIFRKNITGPSLLVFKDGEIIRYKVGKEAKEKLFSWDKKTNVTPFVSDFDGDYVLDSCLWSKETGTFLCTSSILGWKFALPLGQSIDLPVIGNFNGDNITDIGIYRPLDHSFYIRFLGKSVPENIQMIQLCRGAACKAHIGNNGVPQINDYDGDGISDLAIYNPQEKIFVVKKSSDSKEVVFNICNNNLCKSPTPITGDFDGDGKSDPGIIDLKTNELFYYSSRDEANCISMVDQRISGSIFSADVDQDLISDLVFLSPTRKIWGYQSLVNNEYKEFKTDDDNVKLVNCP